MYSESFTIEAENSFAGAMMIEPVAVRGASRDKVFEGDFLSDKAKAVYRATCFLIDQGKPCDATLIQAEAGDSVTVEYCAAVMQMTPTTANAEEYARIIHEAAQERRASRIGFELSTGEQSPIEALEALQDLLRAQSGTVTTPAEDAQAFMDFVTDNAAGRRKPFLSTGFRNLDLLLSGGLISGGLITIAARPGVGKSTVALAIAENVVAAGHKSLYFSLEMPKHQLWSCRAANLSGLSRSAIYSGDISDNDEKSWRRLSEAMQALYERPLYVRDSPSSVEDVEREARCIDGLELIVIDHIGLLKSPDRGSRYEIMTQTTHRLKQLALSLKIPILALCQLNRDSTKRENRRPMLADLRDSGAVEEDSDVVCLLYRPAADLPDEQKPGPWELQDILLDVQKNRHGRTGVIRYQTCLANARVLQ